MRGEPERSAPRLLQPLSELRTVGGCYVPGGGGEFNPHKGVSALGCTEPPPFSLPKSQPGAAIHAQDCLELERLLWARTGKGAVSSCTRVPKGGIGKRGTCREPHHG